MDIGLRGSIHYHHNGNTHKGQDIAAAPAPQKSTSSASKEREAASHIRAALRSLQHALPYRPEVKNIMDLLKDLEQGKIK